MTEATGRRPRSRLARWGRALLAAIVCTAAATLLRFALDPVLGDVAPFATYFAAVVFAAFFIGLRAGILTTILGVVCGVLFFVSPRLSVVLDRPANLIATVLYCVGSGGIVWVAGRLRLALNEARSSVTLLNLLHQVRDRTAGVDTLEGLLQRTVEALQSALIVDTAVVLLREGSRDRLVIRAAVGLPVERGADAPAAVDAFARAVVERRETVTWQGAKDDPLLSPALRAAGTRSLLGVPLIADGEAVGVLHVGRRRTAAFADIEARLLEVVAAPLALAIVRQAAADALRAAEESARRERETLLALAERARTEAELANRAKDDLLATVSHDLRSPLQGVLGWLALLKRSHFDAAQTARALDAIERSVRMQAQLVGDLMDVTRIAAGRIELERLPLDLGELIAATVEEFAPAAETKGVALGLDPVDCCVVLGDSGRLHQVLSNLLSNALKFTPPGGRIAVGCERRGDTLVVRVADTGEGIAPEMLPRLFERFTQADTVRARRQSGLGLGLAIVRHLVELHGGSVAAESAGRGRGATFRVTLPMALGAHVAPPAATNAGWAPGSSSVS